MGRLGGIWDYDQEVNIAPFGRFPVSIRTKEDDLLWM